MSFFKKLLPVDDLKKTILRFPHAAFCSLALFCVVLWLIHGDVKGLDAKVIFRFIALFSYGFFWFCLSRLVMEGGRSILLQRAVSYGVFAALAGLIFLGSGISLVWFLGLMVPALLLGISVGPYIRSSDSLSLWFYNRQTWQGVLISIFAGMIWAAGVSAALLSIRYLFDIEIDHKIYADIWCLSMFAFAPLYALSWIPEKYSYTEEDCHAPPQLSFVLNWVLAPLIMVYMLILYAYFVKIVLIGEIPRGQLAYMIIVFGGAGVVTYLGGWPLRESGGALLRLIYKVFFPALFVPAGMLAYAAYLRIEQYGFTEQRYLLVLVALWFALLAVVYTFRKPPLKIISGSLCVLLLVAAIGPLSAPNIAAYSQVVRLKEVLLANNILVGGYITELEDTPSIEVRREISSMLRFLGKREQMDRVRPWLKDVVKDESVPTLRALTKLMGFEFEGRRYYGGKKLAEDALYLRGVHRVEILDVSGFKYFFDGVYANLRKVDVWEHSWDVDPLVTAHFQEKKLVVSVEGHGEVSFDLYEYALLENEKKTEKKVRDMQLDKVSGDVHVRLIFSSINLGRKSPDEDYQVRGFNFKTLVNY